MIDKERYTRAFTHLMYVEGHLAEHRADKGGATSFGISSRYHPNMWIDGPPTREQAREFYHREFWLRLRCQEIRSLVVAYELFESAVNCGPSDGVKFVQKAYNALRTEGPPTLAEDGRIGPATLASINQMARTHERALVNAQNAKQAQHYFKIAEEDPSQRAFIRGWFANRVSFAEA